MNLNTSCKNHTIFLNSLRMSIITKFVLKEHVAPFLFGIATIVFVFMLNVVFRDLGRLLGKGIPLKVVLEFFYLNMAWIVALAVPMSVLLASLMAFGRLSSDNEITALKASGVPFQRLLCPVLAMAGVVAAFMIHFNNSTLPDFNHRFRLLYTDISRTRPALTLEPDVFFDEIPFYTILVHGVKEKKNQLEGIVINDLHDSKYNQTVSAEKGLFQFDREQERLVLTLFNGEVHEIEKNNLENYRRMRFDKQSLSIGVSDIVLKRSNAERRGDREKSASMMRNDIRKDARALGERIQALNRMAGSDLAEMFAFTDSRKQQTMGDILGFINPVTRTERMLQLVQGELQAIRGYKRSIGSLWVEIHKKYSIPFACLVFVLVGAPLGVRIRQSGLATAGLMSIVFFLVYWSFFIGGEQLADRRFIGPALAMWLPNLVVGAAGILLAVRTAREAPFVSWKKIRSRVIRGKVV